MTSTADTVSHALHELVVDLHAQGRLRVWSLIVTLFGDAIVPRGGRAPLSLIQDAMGLIGIESGAVRTALSRLAADGWVTREREGRNSFYRLAESGRHAFDEATRRIYSGAPPTWDGAWTIAIRIDQEAPANGLAAAMKEMGFVAIPPSTFIRPETSTMPELDDLPKGLFRLTGRPQPDVTDVAAWWPLLNVADAYAGLIDRFAAMRAALGQQPGIGPADAFAARLVLCHHWRRIVLRDPGLPGDLLPANWPGEAARTLVRDAYVSLLPASELWLDQAGMPPLANPQRFFGRFAADQSSR